MLIRNAQIQIPLSVSGPVLYSNTTVLFKYYSPVTLKWPFTTTSCGTATRCLIALTGSLLI